MQGSEEKNNKLSQGSSLSKTDKDQFIGDPAK